MIARNFTMLQGSVVRAGCALRATPRQLAPLRVWGFRRRLLAWPAGRILQVAAVAPASRGAAAGQSPANTSRHRFDDTLDFQSYRCLITMDDKALSAHIRTLTSEESLCSFMKVAEASGKPQLAKQAEQRLECTAAAGNCDTSNPLAPWMQKVESSAESIAAFMAVSQVLGMSKEEFNAKLKWRPYLLSKPAVAMMRINAQSLVERLGSKEAALKLVLDRPEALVVGGDGDHDTHLMQELNWDAGALQVVPKKGAMIHGKRLASPMLRRLLRLCEQVLGVSAGAVVVQHKDVLKDPGQSIARIAFITQHGLLKKITRTRNYCGDTEKSMRFLTESDSAWRRRLQKWGVGEQLWDSFRDALFNSEEWRAFQQEHTEHYMMASSYMTKHDIERVQTALEQASKSTGAK